MVGAAEQLVGDLGLAGPRRRLAQRRDQRTDRAADRAVQLKRLIVHERDERRDDDRHARQDQRGQLEAEALAEPGRQEPEHVAALGDRPDHGELAGLKLGRVVGQTQQPRDLRGPCGDLVGEPARLRAARRPGRW